MVRPKKLAAKARFLQLLKEGLGVDEAAKQAEASRASCYKWAREAGFIKGRSGNAQPPSTRTAIRGNVGASGTSNHGTNPRSAPESLRREPNLDAARIAAGINSQLPEEHTNGTAPAPAPAPEPTPTTEITAEVVMQQADMVVSLVTGGVAVANGLDTADPEVAPHIGLSAKEKAMLEPLAPAVARRMPAILDATDRYAPYIFGAMLVVACASKGLSLSRIAQRRNVVDSEETPGA